ncbi:hypothetical protein G7029_29640 [Pseudomonas carnis]|uniref:hypothetical protein n=1 Tax=Pseudomonas carnis TaxID=2487355 RepID=UPI0015E274A1|nr:hypothetical protein [Pseudomonas carnis]MBA1271632.1 hypothetical protein [Pseudomonas carnis]MBA1302691.1 hypothetical protein [Pseudomonas carnis]
MPSIKISQNPFMARRKDRLSQASIARAVAERLEQSHRELLERANQVTRLVAQIRLLSPTEHAALTTALDQLYPELASD